MPFWWETPLFHGWDSDMSHVLLKFVQPSRGTLKCRCLDSWSRVFLFLLGCLLSHLMGRRNSLKRLISFINTEVIIYHKRGNWISNTWSDLLGVPGLVGCTSITGHRCHVFSLLKRALYQVAMASFTSTVWILKAGRNIFEPKPFWLSG